MGDESCCISCFGLEVLVGSPDRDQNYWMLQSKSDKQDPLQWVMDSCPLWDRMMGFDRNISLLGQVMMHLSWLRGCAMYPPSDAHQTESGKRLVSPPDSSSRSPKWRSPVGEFRARLISPLHILGWTLSGWLGEQNFPRVATACGRKEIMSRVWMCHSCEPSHISQSSFFSGQMSQT